MQDRYLFRAKRIDNGEWAKGFLIKPRIGNYTNIVEDPEVKGEHADVYEIDKSTICQCTGLKDKNGKLIWENDIIECKLGKAVVIWDKYEWKIKWLDDLVWRRDVHCWATDNNGKIKIIGNRFDNPELLEVQE